VIGSSRFYLIILVLLVLAGCAPADKRNFTMQDGWRGKQLTSVTNGEPSIEMSSRARYAPTAEENDAITGSIAALPRALETRPPVPLTRTAKKHVFLILGGLVGIDGWATSAGMLELASSLAALPDVKVRSYDWQSYQIAAHDIALLPKDDLVIVIGYSGGGSRATWLANLPSRPQIDLMILYDPSPMWQMWTIGSNVKRAICYQNTTPSSLIGLGGGVLVGKNTSIETVNIFNDHVLVQVDSALHQRTIAEVKNLSSYDVAARPWRKLIPTALHSD
jgi:hypothetical protein